MTIISAFITNLGKYNEGELAGEWHDFPTTREAIFRTFEEIGIDGVCYEEFFITDYDCEAKGLSEHLGEYAGVDELNYLASKIESLTEWELEAYEAAVEAGDYSTDIKDLINLTENLGCFDYMPGIDGYYDLGYYWVEESGCYDTKGMGSLTNYIDYERFGRDICLDEGGTFASRGYVRNNGDNFIESYDGECVPEEYRVFSMPRQKEPEHSASRQKVSQNRGAR